MIGIQRQLVVQDRAFAAQIEIRMVCQVDDRVAIGGSAVIDAQLVIEQSVIDERGEIAGIALFAVFAEICEMQNVPVFAYGPLALIEPAETAVQMIRAVVARQLIFNCRSMKTYHLRCG